MSNARRIRWVVIVVLLGLAAWFVGTHVGQWKDRFVPRRFRVVELGKIYASGQINQHLIRQVLSQYGIKVIVCLDNDDNSDSDVVAEQTAARDLGIDREIFPLSGDGTGDIHSYANALARIVAANKENVPVLVPTPESVPVATNQPDSLARCSASSGNKPAACRPMPIMRGNPCTRTSTWLTRGRVLEVAILKSSSESPLVNCSCASTLV